MFKVVEDARKQQQFSWGVWLYEVVKAMIYIATALAAVQLPAPEEAQRGWISLLVVVGTGVIRGWNNYQKNKNKGNVKEEI